MDKQVILDFIVHEYIKNEHDDGHTIDWKLASHFKTTEEEIEVALTEMLQEGLLEERRFTKNLVLAEKEKRKVRPIFELIVKGEPYLNRNRVWSKSLVRTTSIWGFEVDRGIAEGIAMCNNLGYPTWACCSGLKEDHEDKKVGKGHPYIAFKVSGDYIHSDFYENIRTAAYKANLSFEDEELLEEMETGIVFYLTFFCVRNNKNDSDEVLKKKWNVFFETLKELSSVPLLQLSAMQKEV